MINLTKRGKYYHADATVAGKRLRGSLGTDSLKIATQVSRRLEFALAAGPHDSLWQELKSALPKSTYQTFSAGKVAEPLTVEAVWTGYYFKQTRRKQLGEISDSTYVRYTNVAIVFSNWVHDLGVHLMDEITPTMIEEYRAYRLAQTLQRKQSRGGQGLDVEVVVLKQIFDLAIEMGYSKPNPVKSISRTKVKPVRGAEPFTREELNKIGEACDIFEWPVFLLLRWTGLRGSDAVRVRWRDFNLTEGILTLDTQKRGKKVIIPLHKDFLEVLRRVSDSDSDDLYLDGMTRPQLYNLVRRLGNKAGVPNCHPHRFRDTLAVDMLAKGGTIFDVAKILGDTVATVEKHYAPFTDKLQERVRGILEKEG